LIVEQIIYGQVFVLIAHQISLYALLLAEPKVLQLLYVVSVFLRQVYLHLLGLRHLRHLRLLVRHLWLLVRLLGLTKRSLLALLVNSRNITT
jgi:hypothetical protein